MLKMKPNETNFADFSFRETSEFAKQLFFILFMFREAKNEAKLGSNS
jgi:hypothetical protein